MRQVPAAFFEWSHIEGFGDRDLERLSAFIHNNAALILRLAREATSVLHLSSICRFDLRPLLRLIRGAGSCGVRIDALAQTFLKFSFDSRLRFDIVIELQVSMT